MLINRQRTISRKPNQPQANDPIIHYEGDFHLACGFMVRYHNPNTKQQTGTISTKQNQCKTIAADTIDQTTQCNNTDREQYRGNQTNAI
jgi:hypothetical protein